MTTVLVATVELEFVGNKNFATAIEYVPNGSHGSSRLGEILFWGNFTISVRQKADVASLGFPNRRDYIPISDNLSY
ncbi:MAG TPA: hypothetical protein VJ810_27510 [Blastocatellia bacterium]|nr:hypothetical protein [Blastocatellia bacterium]